MRLSNTDPTTTCYLTADCTTGEEIIGHERSVFVRSNLHNPPTYDRGYLVSVLAANSATSPGWRAIGTPTSSKARIFSSAVPLPLEMIAPA